MKEQEINKENLIPVHMVSSYHYILRAPGSLYRKKAIKIHLICYQEDVFFIDHSNGYVSIKYQLAIKSTETVKAKINFDREAILVIIQPGSKYKTNILTSN